MLDKAKESLSVAEMSHENSWHNSAANRAYFAMYQSAVGVLDFYGIQRPNEGWWPHRVLFHRLELVQFPEYFRDYIMEGFSLRIQADYYLDAPEREEVSKMTLLTHDLQSWAEG